MDADHSGSSHHTAPRDGLPEVWGSDVMADMLRALGLPYVCLVPGSSFRGLHDSVVNYLGNRAPQMLLCLHEEHAVAIAHGWAKVTGRPLGVIVHANVGLMHATMAIFDAWCDRMPVIVVGATGPVDATRRRPWVDWIHTARDQGALVRHYVKWDDQPASIAAAQESLLRAGQIATTAPYGPVYVCLDAGLQEAKLDAVPRPPDIERFRSPASAQAAPELVRRAAEWLRAAAHPVILMGRVSRDEEAWRARVALAEQLGATVLTDLRTGAAFPTDHPLHGAAPGLFLSPEAAAELRSADVVLSLDWVDLAGTLKQASGTADIAARVIQVSVDQFVHNGWSMDHQGLAPSDLYLLCQPDTVVAQLLDAVRPPARRAPTTRAPRASSTSAPPVGGPITLARLAHALRHAAAAEPVCLLRLPTGWPAGAWHFRHPLDYIGYDGGGGVGSGPGIAVGAALALKGTGRLPIAILGDGDYLMGLTALWTAAHSRIPLLVVVANNNSYLNDELHQERVARERGRPVENRWIGQRIADPEPDLALLARGLGVSAIGPVEQSEALDAALGDAVATVKQGAACVVDVRVEGSYAWAVSSALMRGEGATS
ncbi:MAG TPA: thiamine pyrophosphate-binding protein [bacterium]|nr:thiamine pyrophosphate-binding protein [bacterium]